MKEVFELRDRRLVEIIGDDFEMKFFTPKNGLPDMRELILETELSQAQFSDRSGVHRSTLSRCICRAAVPHPESVKNISTALSIPPRDVVEAFKRCQPKNQKGTDHE